MRIIAGTARSLPLKAVDGIDTRPTTDRIKETLFNIIAPEVPDAVFLDLFAGSGAIGLEALSRGAKRAVFVDHSRKAVSVIRENIEFTGFDSQSKVLYMDFSAALKALTGQERFDLVFLDPPYGKGLSAYALEALSELDLCGDDALVIVEEAIDFHPEELETDGFEIVREKKYKNNQHIFLRRRLQPARPQAEYEKGNLSGEF